VELRFLNFRFLNFKFSQDSFDLSERLKNNSDVVFVQNLAIDLLFFLYMGE